MGTYYTHVIHMDLKINFRDYLLHQDCRSQDGLVAIDETPVCFQPHREPNGT